MRNTSGIIKLISLAWFSVIGLSACGGGASTEGNPNGSGGSASGSSLITAATSTLQISQMAVVRTMFITGLLKNYPPNKCYS